MMFFENFKKEEVVHEVTEKSEGNVNPFSKGGVENIIKALSGAGIGAKRDNLVFAEQVHGKKAYVCPENVGGIIKLGVDALISENPGQILFIKTADCVPILVYDPKGKVAAIHAGRKGLVKGVVEEAIGKMKTDNSNLLVGIGPHIRSCCYFLRGEVGEYERDWKEYLEKREGKHFFDLTGLVLDKLEGLGVKAGNIEDARICTYCGGGRFFSARKRDDYEDISCFGSFIGL